MTYELKIEMQQLQEDEALAIARDLSGKFAARVTVTEVTSAGSRVAATIEPSS